MKVLCITTAVCGLIIPAAPNAAARTVLPVVNPHCLQRPFGPVRPLKRPPLESSIRPTLAPDTGCPLASCTVTTTHPSLAAAAGGDAVSTGAGGAVGLVVTEAAGGDGSFVSVLPAVSVAFF